MAIMGLMVMGSMGESWAKGKGNSGDSMAEHMERSFPPPHMMKELDLSEDQVAKIKAIHEKRKVEMMEAKKNVREAHQVLHQELGTDASEEALREKFKSVQSARQAMAQVHFEEVLEVRSILTPDQRKKFEGMSMERGKRGWDKQGNGEGKRKNRRGG